MFIFSHFHASVIFTHKPFHTPASNKNIQVQVDQSQDHAAIHTDRYVSAYTRRFCGSNVKNQRNGENKLLNTL